MPVAIHGKQYATVNERIEEVHEEYKGRVSIETDIISSIEGTIRVKATLTVTEMAEGMQSHSNTFTGHAEEIVGSTMINKTSALENAETSAVGRALAFAGFSTDASIASADEVANAIANQNALGRAVSNRKSASPGESAPIVNDLKKEVSDNWDDYRGGAIDFGKHKGEPWSDLPMGYLSWLAGTKSDTNPKNNQMAVMELEYRQDGNPEEEGGRIVVDNTEDLKSAITKDKGTKELFD
jgi:hypothetical protein|tara:strand:- start:539 stop:1255 length:717 start_codon:yes stop_codon:yes gene_type:complete